jgi:hypothetical protein
VETISMVIKPYKTILVNAGRYFPENRFGDYLGKREIGQHVIKPIHPEAKRCCKRIIPTLKQSLVKLEARVSN